MLFQFVSWRLNVLSWSKFNLTHSSPVKIIALIDFHLQVEWKLLHWKLFLEPSTGKKNTPKCACFSSYGFIAHLVVEPNKHIWEAQNQISLQPKFFRCNCLKCSTLVRITALYYVELIQWKNKNIKKFPPPKSAPRKLFTFPLSSQVLMVYWIHFLYFLFCTITSFPSHCMLQLVSFHYLSFNVADYKK